MATSSYVDELDEIGKGPLSASVYMATHNYIPAFKKKYMMQMHHFFPAGVLSSPSPEMYARPPLARRHFLVFMSVLASVVQSAGERQHVHIAMTKTRMFTEPKENSNVETSCVVRSSL
jgi:hypothetical protein